MDREALIKRSMKRLNKLPIKRINEVADFIDFISNKYKEEIELQKGIENLVENTNSFSFLNEEEYLYTIKDLKEKYRND